MDKHLKQISRDQAEQFFNDSEVLKSQIEQTQEELRISFALSSNNSILVVYKSASHEESFYLKGGDITRIF